MNIVVGFHKITKGNVENSELISYSYKNLKNIKFSCGIESQ